MPETQYITVTTQEVFDMLRILHELNPDNYTENEIKAVIYKAKSMYCGDINLTVVR